MKIDLTISRWELCQSGLRSLAEHLKQSLGRHNWVPDEISATLHSMAREIAETSAQIEAQIKEQGGQDE